MARNGSYVSVRFALDRTETRINCPEGASVWGVEVAGLAAARCAETLATWARLDLGVDLDVTTDLKGW